MSAISYVILLATAVDVDIPFALIRTEVCDINALHWKIFTPPSIVEPNTIAFLE